MNSDQPSSTPSPAGSGTGWVAAATAVAVAVAGVLLSTGQNVRSADKTPATSVASQPAPVAAQVAPATGREIAYADLNTDQPHYDESAGMLVGRRR